VLAGIYFGAAKLSLLFAIPPGYATPGVAALGIAVARCSCWAGASGRNPDRQPGGESDCRGVGFASAMIAAGSSVQALAASTLLRRHVGIPYRFTTVAQVVNSRPVGSRPPRSLPRLRWCRCRYPTRATSRALLELVDLVARRRLGHPLDDAR